jgi:hypothetical protein
VVVIVPSFFFIDWAIETTRTSPSIPVAFYAQPRAVGPGFDQFDQSDSSGWCVWPASRVMLPLVITKKSLACVCSSRAVEGAG